jgi:hypothetical protein
MAEPVFIKLGMYIVAHESISMPYFINPSHQSVCPCQYPYIFAGQRLGKNPPTVARQRLRKILTAATKTQAKIEEFLDASFSTRSVWCQGT